MPLLRYTDDCLNAAQGRWPASGQGGWGDLASNPAAPKRPDRPKSIRVFENGFIEKVFAQAHPLTPIIWFGPIIAWGIYGGATRLGVLATLGLFVGGWLIWTLLEYVLHRFLFHIGASNEEERFRAFMMHGYHHEFPNDKMRLVAPPLMSWPLAIPVFFIYYFAFGLTTGTALFAGTATGYIAYDWIHYYTHHFRPTTRMGKWIKSYHLLHHFDELHGTKRFGVSSPLWDFVFRTYAPVRKRAAE